MLTNKYKTEQQREIAEVNTASRQKTWLVYIFMIAFGLSIVISLLTYLNSRQKQRSNDKLAFQQLEQERQKLEIILQRDELELQKNLVIHQRDKIIAMLTDLGESIDYARKIQQAILPSEKMLRTNLGEHFLIFQPRESVGGDFYWTATYENLLCFAVADCTGHGVPGGFMSMLGVSMLNELIARKGTCSPGFMLDTLRAMTIKALSQTGLDEDTLDGMDISLCVYNLQTRQLAYAGANMPIFIVAANPPQEAERIINYGLLTEVRPDRMPISYYQQMDNFVEQQFSLCAGDSIYLFTDGFVDQFGGDRNKKFGYPAFRSLLQSVSKMPFDVQKAKLWHAFEKWKGEESQTDDVLVLGIST